MTSYNDLGIITKMLTAGTSACIADFATYPLDTAKVRLQIQGEARNVVHNDSIALLRSEAQNGLYTTVVNMVRQEGARSLYNGLSAGLQRQMCFASVRIGFYDNFKAYYQQLFSGKNRTDSLNIGSRVAAGLTTGGLAVLLAQPTDVVKIRFQACINGNGGSARRYTSTLQAYKDIARKEGVRGLWKGTFPNVTRNAIVNVSEIVCYDVVKDSILHWNLMNDKMPLHLVSAVVAGLCTTIVASPVDVVKTRYMNSSKGQYKGAIDCAIRMFMQEGAKSFYKGFVPSFGRLLSWNVAMWVTYEQMKILVTKTYA